MFVRLRKLKRHVKVKLNIYEMATGDKWCEYIRIFSNIGLF